MKKLAKIRVELQNMKLPKSGVNKYSNFTYYELGDFLPAINKLEEKYGLLHRFNIIPGRHEKAVLTIIDTETGEKLDFVAPTANAMVGKRKDGSGGAQPIQNLGAKITYMRRYMLMTAYGIVENDLVDRVNMELNEAMDEKDLKRLESAKSMTELTAIAGELKKLYRPSIIAPIYEQMKKKLKGTK